jgi:hypothetical protein
MTVLDEVPTVVPTCGGGIEALVPSPTHRYAAAWLNSGQGENGYDVYRVDGPLTRVTHLQHAANPMNHPPMYCLPVFSPDERVLACAPGVRAEVAWWTPPYSAWPHDWTGEEAEIPSLGGPTTFGTLVCTTSNATRKACTRCGSGSARAGCRPTPGTPAGGTARSGWSSRPRTGSA